MPSFITKGVNLDMVPVYKTERRTVRHREVPDEPLEAVTFHRTRYRASDAPSQSAIDTGHYLEIADMPASHQVQVEETSSHHGREASSVNQDYENPEVPYEELDASTVVNRGPPEPSVYDDLAH